jgi:hypothetical protein
MDLNLHWLKFAIDNMISLSNSIGLNNVWYVLLAPRKLNVLFNILLLPQELYTGGNDRQILVWSPARSIADEMVHSLNQFIDIIFYICMLRAPSNLSLSDLGINCRVKEIPTIRIAGVTEKIHLHLFHNWPAFVFCMFVGFVNKGLFWFWSICETLRRAKLQNCILVAYWFCR